MWWKRRTYALWQLITHLACWFITRHKQVKHLYSDQFSTVWRCSDCGRVTVKIETGGVTL